MSQDDRSERAAERARRSQALAVLGDADSALDGWTCSATTECCQFGVTGREPYLTEVEWRVMEAEIARQGRRVPPPRDDRVCPFLSAGRCTVYLARPLGCRTYFCHRASGPRVARARTADLPHRLEQLSRGDSRGSPLTTWLDRARRRAR